MHKREPVERNPFTRGLCWNAFILFYLGLSIILLTLHPFQFQSFAPAEQWKWEFTLQDFTRNVLFFSPFGLVVRHLFRKPHVYALAVGFLFSLSVEMTQLFLPIRASNFSDLLSNSTGALLGSLFHQWAFAFSLPSSVGVPFAFMLMPLCWTIALIADAQPAAALAILPYAIAGLILMNTIVLRDSKTLFKTLKKNSVIALWCIVVLLPLVSVFHFLGFVFIAAVPAVLGGIQQLNPYIQKRLIPLALLVGFAVAVSTNSFWYFTTPDPVWKPSDPIWNLTPSLRLIEILLSGITALSAQALTDLLPNLRTGDQPVR